MTRVALKALWSRKLRTFLTGFAIVLGVATITGHVCPHGLDLESLRLDLHARSTRAPTPSSRVRPPSTSARTRASRSRRSTSLCWPKVQGAAHSRRRRGRCRRRGAADRRRRRRDPVRRRAEHRLLDRPRPGPLQLHRAQRGRLARRGDVAVDTSTASKEDIEVGEQIGVQAEGPVRRLRVSGLFDFSSEGNIGGATLAAFDLRTAQQLFNKVGQARPDSGSCGGGYDARRSCSRRSSPSCRPAHRSAPGEGQADEDADETQSFLSFLQGFLLAFGGIALFVGAFVIANSLSITIAQRTREFATLRTIGASRRQIMRAVLRTVSRTDARPASAAGIRCTPAENMMSPRPI